MCCMTRRRFLQVTSAWAGGMMLSRSLPSAATVERQVISVPSQLAGTGGILRDVVTKYGPLEDDAWVLMHAVRAMGRDFAVKGERATDILCSRFLKQETVAGKSYLYMPIDLEGHTNTLLKTLLEAGVSLSHPFRLGGKRYTVGDLMNSAKGLLTFDPKSSDPDDIAWTLIAFSREIPPSRDTWTNAYGQQLRFADLVRFGFDVLDESCRKLQRAKDRGVMATEKDTIHGFTCGGTHLIYGLAACVGNGYHRDDFVKRLQAHLDLLVWRLEAEGHLLEQFYRQSSPQAGMERIYDIFFRNAMMKFYGHSFEILSYVKHKRLFAPSPDQVQVIERAGAKLATAVKGIEGVDLFEFRKTNLRLFHLLVGDACHAYHGIQMAPGVNQV